jgi:hypothetical protein
MFTHALSFKKIGLVKWDIRDTSNQSLEIKNELYQFIQKKHITKKRYISNNDYFKRFWNSIAHIITLHFSTVFYDMIYDLLEEHKGKLIGVSIPRTITTPSVNEILQEFKDSLFNFDPQYKNGERNLGQEIVLYLYKIKYSSEIKEDKQLPDLESILKLKLKKIINLNSKERDVSYNQQIEKIILNLKAFFEVFSKKIIIFLTNYIKFIELQYNLQAIRKAL